VSYQLFLLFFVQRCSLIFFVSVQLAGDEERKQELIRMMASLISMSSKSVAVLVN